MNTYQSGWINKIKLCIWDLDETFWVGTIDDGDIPQIPQSHITLIKTLTDHGIVNSICSKNDFSAVKKILKENNLWDYFVFPSIDWSPKGNRIKLMLESMGLRAANALFIDDNPLNIEEAEYCVPDLMTALPSVVDVLLQELSATDIKVDMEHKRLNQYKLLEVKADERSHYSSSKDFLMSCKIKVEIHTDCKAEKSRIYELVQRSNQLNFTKVRSSERNIEDILNNPAYQCGTVWVSDRFGDYGMVGFYALCGGRAEHFLFSCRTIGMGIEQYVFQKLGCPAINTVGEVASELLPGADLPAWINVDNVEDRDNLDAKIIRGGVHSVLIKGPCDMSSIFNYIHNADVIDTEFTQVDRESGVSLQGSQHTVQILESLVLTNEQKQSISHELPFASNDFFETDMFSGKYTYIFLSLLHESHLGVYRRKSDGVKVVFGEAAYPLTDTQFWEDYIQSNIYTGGCKLSKNFLEWFCLNYDFCGRISTQELHNNILEILANLPHNAHLILMLGVEYPCAQNENPAFSHSHEVFAEHNAMIRKLAEEQERISYIYYGDFLNGQDGFYKNNYHFTPEVYYKIAAKICEILNHKNNEIALSIVNERYIKKAEMRIRFKNNPVVSHVVKAVKSVLKLRK